MINPLIPLGVKPLELGKAYMEGREFADKRDLRGQQMSESQARVEALGKLAEKRDTENKNAIDDRRMEEWFSSVAPAAVVTKDLFDSGDLVGAKAFLDRRISDLEKKGIDTEDTREIRELLDTNPSQAVADLDAVLLEARNRGFDPTTGFKASAVSKLYGNGTAVQSLNNGETVVRDPSGRIVTGEDRIQVLQEAQDAEVAATQEKAGARTAGAESVKLSTKMFEKIEPIKQQIMNYNDAIEALDSGADTGPVVSRLPSVRANAVALDNAQKQLGLNVIQNTTFGSLSEGELALALDTALPKNLEPPQLKAWLTKRRDAQARLLNYIESAASYLSVPGATIGGFMDAQKELGQATRRKGFKLMEDANGNRAWVGPNGEVEPI